MFSTGTGAEEVQERFSGTAELQVQVQGVVQISQDAEVCGLAEVQR